jgi:ubiquinone biosynthesis protein COQ4
MKYQSSAEFSGTRWDGSANPAPRSAWDAVRSFGRGVIAAPTRWVTAVRLFVLVIACKERRIYYGVRFLLATEGNTFERSFTAFAATPAGRDLLERRPNSCALVRNRSMLAACPPGSLGDWYADFMTGQGFDEQLYLNMAIENGARLADPARAWFRTRVEGSHDMRHVLTGYGPDKLGEICLLSFRFGQICHSGMLCLTFLGFTNLKLCGITPALAPLLEAYRRGRHARPLDSLPWENQLAQPLSTIRANLGLTPPQHYPSPFAPETYVVSEQAVR